MFEITSTCKGGGYMYCRTFPKHPNANSKGLYPLHRVLMENKLGRLLLMGEVVHHIDEDKNNNDVTNLLVLSASDHAKLHRPELDKIELVCDCGVKFKVKPHCYRNRMKRIKSNRLFCSRSCGVRNQYAMFKK